MTNSHSAWAASSVVETSVISNSFSLADKIACLSVVVLYRPQRLNGNRKLQASSRTSLQTQVHSNRVCKQR